MTDNYAPITPEIKDAVAWLFAVDMVRDSWPEWGGDTHEVRVAKAEALSAEAMGRLSEGERDTAEAIHWGSYLPECAVSRIRIENGLWGTEKYWSPKVEGIIGRKAFRLLGADTGA